MLHNIELDIEDCDSILNKEKTFLILRNDDVLKKDDYVVFTPVDHGKVFPHDISGVIYRITYTQIHYALFTGYIAISIVPLSDKDLLKPINLYRIIKHSLCCDAKMMFSEWIH